MTSPVVDRNQDRGIWPLSAVHRQWKEALQARGFARVVKLGACGLEVLVIAVVIAIVII